MFDNMEKEKRDYQYKIAHWPFTDEMWKGKLSVSLGHSSCGWILLWISSTSFTQAVTIYTSDVYDPYPEIVQWLEKIRINDMPCHVEIDEEGTYKTLRAATMDKDTIDFQIYDAMEDDIREEHIIFRTRIPKQQCISEFVTAMKYFLETKHDPEEWSYGFDLAALDFTNLQNYLNNLV